VNLIRNQWYEIFSDDSGLVFARWRDATADQTHDVFCFEKRLNNDIIFYNEYTEESEAIARLELAINTGD
jgi:hypothetical protein